MSDKTCGTCGKSGVEFRPCNASTYVSAQNGTSFYCPRWTERTDSVERVALELFIEAANANGYVDDTHKMKLRQYADRLRNFGIEVPE